MNTDIKEVINLFLKKKNLSSNEVKEILSSIEKDNRFTWRDLGDLHNNRGRINIVTSKDHTLVERVTNAIDACIERKAENYPDIKKKKSIAEVQNFLMEKKLWDERKEVGVEIFPLKETKTTNFLFVDKGIGIDNEKMPYTILFFNSGHKADKDYLRGSFGQGGSTVCRYSDYTVIITKSSGKTSFTIVRRNEKDKNKKYEYLVDKSNEDYNYKQIAYQGQPEKNYLPTFVENFDFYGTLIIHISYDLYKTSFVDYYNIFEENLFNSYLTYRLYLLDKKENASRPMRGLKNRLENLFKDGKVEKGSSTTFSLIKNEKAKMVYYYLKESYINSYVSDARKHPIFVTFNGQTHTRLRKSLISEANLSKLTNKLIMEINCNQLSDDLRDILFDSSRQRLDKEYEQILEKSAVNFLKNDEFLQQEQLRLEEESRKKEIGENTEEYRKELASMIESFSPGKYNVNKPGSQQGLNLGVSARLSKLPTEPIELLEVPTYFNITNKGDNIKAIIGKKCNIKLESNITNQSFGKNRCYIEIDKSLAEKIDCSIPNIRNGRAIAVLIFKNANIGNKIPISFSLKSGDHKINLSTKERIVEIIEEKKKTPKGSISIDAPYPIEVYRYGKNKDLYLEYGWDKDEKISKVDKGNKISIYVNMSHSKLKEFLESLGSTSNLETIKTEYFLSMSLASFLQSEDLVFKKLNVDTYGESEEIKDRSLLITSQTLFMILKNSKKKNSF